MFTKMKASKIFVVFSNHYYGDIQFPNDGFLWALSSAFKNPFDPIVALGDCHRHHGHHHLHIYLAWECAACKGS